MEQILPVPNPIISYWLSEPHEFSNLRSTPDLPDESDIVIIGSGMAGIMTAYHILKENNNNPSITILEARQLCSGATGRNGGHSKIKVTTMTELTSKCKPEDVNELESYVLGIIDGWKQVVDEEKLECELELRRSFHVHLDQAESDQVYKIVDDNRKAGQSWTKNVIQVDDDRVEQETKVKNGISASTVPACSFFPYKFVTQLLSRLIDRHPQTLNVQTNTPVTSIATDSDDMSILTTPRGVLKAHRLVIATNAYTSGVLPQFKDVIVPIKGMASHIIPSKRRPTAPTQPLKHTYNISFGPSLGTDYINPRPDGSLVAGGWQWDHKPFISAWFNNFDDSKGFPEEVERFWEGYAGRTFFGWEEGEVLDKVWVGIMGITPDGWPHVGRVPGVPSKDGKDGVGNRPARQWMLAGFNGAGMGLIYTAAKAVAKMVTGDLGFEDVRAEFGIPSVFGTSEERLKGADWGEYMSSRS